MANVRKKISELTPLTSASLDTVVVGVDNGTTYKIELDVLADAVTSRVNTLDRDRLSSLESVTSSFETKGRSILSGSISYTSLTNIPQGIVSQSTDLTSLNSKTGSYATTGSNVFRGNQTISGSVSILIPGGTATGLNENPSSNNEFWSNDSNVRDVQIGWTAAVEGGGTYTVTNVQLDVPFAPFVAVTLSDPSVTLGYRVRVNFSKNSKLWQFNNDGTLTGLPSGLISGSSQLTSSYDSRYVISGSITQTIWDNIASKPNDIVSSSQQISDLGFVTGSYTTINEFNNLTQSFNIISGSVVNITNAVDVTQLNNTTASLNNFTSSYFTDSSSFDTKITTEKNRIDAILSASNANTDTFAEVVSLINSVDLTNDNAFATFYTSSNNRITSLENSTGSYLTSLPTGILSGSISYTSLTNIPIGIVSQSTDLTSLNQFTASFSTASLVNRLNAIETISGSWITESETGSFLTSLSGAISSSSQLTSSFDTRYTLSGSVQPLPSGLISGSSQLTASYDTRYTLSGSVVSGTTPAGTISGSSQLTSSFDGRYVQTGSFNTLTASFNSFTASAQSVTTGSNSFNGTQTITGSLIITSGSFIGSQILANTSSLYLTSGSNLYVQNNAVVEITGSLTVKGTTTFVTVGGDEGGEFQFGIPATNTTLQNRVTVDVWRDRLRIFEGSADAKGVHIDLSKAPTGASGEIVWKSSGFVNAGTFVQLDNLKATVPSSGNRGLSLATVSGTINGYISGHYQGISSSSSGISGATTITTSATTSIFGWNFGAEGDMVHYILRDNTNSRVYRILLIIGGSYLNNFISIERLY